MRAKTGPWLRRIAIRWRWPRRWGARTVAFPSISTGVYGFPIPRAATIALGTIRDGLKTHGGIEVVTLVCFNEANYEAYERLLGASA